MSRYRSFPYLASANYREPFRGQFHYSVPSGWMNDINGLWYYGGVYHLMYQSNPHDLTANVENMHWAHAVSGDLIHWEQKPIALEPDLNSTQAPWSGSTVVDVDNTSGLQSGQNPVVVTLYTGTSKGTCLAYSNDLGETWQDYDENPLFPGSYEPRDPHVFRHVDHWVMALYENGTTFYISDDLKSWRKSGNISFGFECPDMYELAVDGDDSNKMWVLQDASGSYLLGEFDGFTFTQKAGPYKMDVGPDFYAAQTFFRSTLPDDRVIQLAWLGNWATRHGLYTSPWLHETTFPVELALRTFADGIRVTRTPAAELANLRGDGRKWPAQRLAPRQNPLESTYGRCFELSAEFDLTDTDAGEIRFELGSKTFSFDIAARSIFGREAHLTGNYLPVRILADAGQLEVFINGGEFSFSEKFGFDPEDDAISVTADGAICMLSAEFNPLRRIWGEAPEPAFESEMGGKWSTARGEWCETAIGMEGRSAEGYACCLHSETVSDGKFGCDVSAMIGPAAGLVVRANDDCTEGILAEIDADYESGKSCVRLRNIGTGEETEAKREIHGGDIYRLEVEARGESIRVFLDGVAILETKCSRTSGRCGFAVRSGCFREKENAYPYPGYGVFQKAEFVK